MLKRLYISNFALIEEMDVSFPGGLTVITGETGAGKSIFLEALGLVLGKRADLAALKNKTRKCIVEAEFGVKGLDLAAFFEENELEPDTSIILRREINADGKSRSFLNDSVVSLSALKTLSEQLIDIHSQHQTLLLNQGSFQMEVLDAFAGSLELFRTYKSEYKNLNRLRQELESLQEQEALARKELDYTQFLFGELEQADIRPGQLRALEEESQALENAETIKGHLFTGAQVISGGDENVLSALSQVKQALQSNVRYGKHYAEFYERLNSAYIELKELASDLGSAEEAVLFDGARLEEVNTGLDRLNRLMKKHGVNTEEALLELRAGLESRLEQFGSLGSEIDATAKELTRVQQTCNTLAKELTALRTKAIPGIEKQIREMLSDLAMENAVFRIVISQQEEAGLQGFDQVKYVFSANKGAALSELHKVASGGELSRLMLSLKALLATKKQLPAIIFDEIDTGVSGEVAHKIGNILMKMGASMQVITITHLPQMASKGRHHLFVYKKDEEDKTVSYIRELSREDRVTEIAKMLSGNNPSQSALKNAKELLSLG
jgi:DNA repair protein RecN (Recombination protein N)